MKFDKKGKIFLSIIAVVFLVFNILFFLVADTTEINTTTIVSWVFMVLGFASFLIFSHLSANREGISTVVIMRLTILGHCALYLIIDFVLALFFTVLGSFVDVPLLWSVSIQLIALGVHVAIALSCFMATSVVEDVQKNVQNKTSRMKGFRVDSEMLIEYCTDASAKEDFRKFAEAVRYSDPTSSDALTEIENDLEEIIAEMKHHLLAGEIEAAQHKCKIANNILKERNKKCLMFK